jgi:hypothetical protein
LRLFNTGNTQRGEVHQRIHTLLAKAKIEQCIQDFLISNRDVQIMIELALLHPVITEQGI